MSSGNKRRFFDRNSTPVVATDDDFDAVFGSATEQPESTAQDVPIERIRPNPFQARVKFKDIDVLADSMRTHGFTSRLRVRRDPSQPQFFQLVYGERRLRAAQAAGVKLIPCDVALYTDQQMRELGLTENLQRTDLEPLEEARAFRTAIDEGGYSIRSLATQIGKSKGYVQGRLDVLRAPPDVLKMVDEHPETFTAGLLIAQLASPELRAPLISSVLQGTLDKEALRAIVRDVAATNAIPARFDGMQSSAQGKPDAAQHGAEATRSHVSKQRNSNRERTASALHSAHALRRSQQTLRTMMRHLQSTIPDLAPNDRAALLDYITQEHFPELEAILQELREPQA